MLSRSLEITLSRAAAIAASMNHEYVTLEHLLLALIDDQDAANILQKCNVDTRLLKKSIKSFLKQMDSICMPQILEPRPTLGFYRVVNRTIHNAKNMGKICVNGANMLAEIFSEIDAHSVALLNQHNITSTDVLNHVLHDVIFGNDNVENERNLEEDFIRTNKSTNNDFQKKHDSNILANYCVNLNRKAMSGQLDPLINREDEIDRTLDILSRRRKNNPLYVGDPGVGKTAIAEGLANRIVNGQVPSSLSQLTIYMLDLGALIAGTRYRGDFEERFKNMISELSNTPNAVLFIDEIHTIIGAGSTNGNALDASNLLKPPLARGAFRCIGSTTYREYKMNFSKDAALRRRFQLVDINESTVDETIGILHGIKDKYESHHKLSYTNSAIKAAAVLSDRYILDKTLPDKAIDILDEAGAHYRLMGKSVIGAKHIAQIVSNLSSVPYSKLSKGDKELATNLSKKLKQDIFGQDEIIDKVVSMIKIVKAGLREKDKPLCSFLFVGPTGVGKTELAKSISTNMNMKLLRFDMSEYKEPHSISRMLGSPPGYIGHEQGGLLTDMVSKYPHSVVLLDEIEKSHSDLYNILLQIMDYGFVTDNLGRSVNFRNVIIIMTSNVGSSDGMKTKMGFTKSSERQSIDDYLLNETFSKEFINRINSILSFNHISQDQIKFIADKLLADLQNKLDTYKIKLNITEDAYEHLIGKAYSYDYGVRALARFIDEKIKSQIADKILDCTEKKPSQINLNLSDGNIKITDTL